MKMKKWLFFGCAISEQTLNKWYLYVYKNFRKVWCNNTKPKKSYEGPKLSFLHFAGEFGTRSLCTHVTVIRSRNWGSGRVAIEPQHEKGWYSILSGLSVPQYNGKKLKIPVKVRFGAKNTGWATSIVCKTWTKHALVNLKVANWP